MTAAGVGSLLALQARSSRRFASPSAAAIRCSPCSRRRLPARITRSRRRSCRSTRRSKKGMAWLASNYTTADANMVGQSIYYALYGLERIAAFADRQTIGRVDLMEKGRSFIRSSQKPDGSWHALPQTDDMNTVWAILYLTKSTAKSIKRVNIKRLGAGTLVGGRYLPKRPDLDDGGRRADHEPPHERRRRGDAGRPGGPPRPERGHGGLGPDRPVPARGPDALRPYKDRFRKLLTDRDPGMRQVAAWALAHTGGPGRRSRPDHGTGRSRRERRDRRAHRASAPEPEDRRSGPSQPFDARAAAGGRQGLARMVRGDPSAGCGRGRRRPGDSQATCRPSAAPTAARPCPEPRTMTSTAASPAESRPRRSSSPGSSASRSTIACPRS